MSEQAAAIAAIDELIERGRVRSRRGRIRRRRFSRLGKTLIAIGILLVGLCGGGFGLFTMMASRVSGLEPAPLTAVDARATAPTTFSDSPVFPEVDWEYWRSINPAVVGWVSVPDTPINYAIVMADRSDPDYYLTHDIYGDYNIFGCPYVDAECAPPFQSPNTVIYGHHMSNGTMFAAFSLFSDRDFADAHRFIYVSTPTEQRVYEVQAADIIDGADAVKRTAFVDHDDFLAYYRDRLAKSDMQRFTADDAPSCITFCTCSYHFNPANERTLVFATPSG